MTVLFGVPMTVVIVIDPVVVITRSLIVTEPRYYCSIVVVGRLTPDG
jgi:hypothetical protein